MPEDKNVEIKIGLHIEDDQTMVIDGKLVEAVFVAWDPDKSGVLHVQGTNYEPSPAGAARIAAVLQMAADGILAELGESSLGGRLVAPTVSEQEQPKRPRFNPQPRVGQKKE